MKHSLFHLLNVAAIALTLVFTSSCRKQAVQPPADDAVDTLEVDNFDRSPYYGDTLCRYDNKTVCMTYLTEETADGTRSLDHTILITLTDSVPTDTCVLVNFNNFKVEGEVLRLTVGGDTMRVSFRELPDRIDAVSSLMVKGFYKYRFRYLFSLDPSADKCEYDFTAYLPKPAPEWTRRLISVMLNNGIRSMYVKRMDCALDEYNGKIRENRQNEQIDVAKMNPVEIARYYARLNKKLYTKDFSDYAKNSPSLCPKYDYMFNMTPAWVSADSSLITYRIETFCYMMGAHGLPEEYFLTFEAESGKLLSWEDILTEDDYRTALGILAGKYKEYRSSYTDDDIAEYFSPVLEKADLYSNLSSIIKEEYQGKYYPRPALTNNGLLFSYQPYEAGSFGEGILHFIVPYSAVPQIKEY